MKKVKCGVSSSASQTSMWLTLTVNDHLDDIFHAGPASTLDQDRDFLMCIYHLRKHFKQRRLVIEMSTRRGICGVTTLFPYRQHGVEALFAGVVSDPGVLGLGLLPNSFMSPNTSTL